MATPSQPDVTQLLLDWSKGGSHGQARMACGARLAETRDSIGLTPSATLTVALCGARFRYLAEADRSARHKAEAVAPPEPPSFDRLLPAAAHLNGAELPRV